MRYIDADALIKKLFPYDVVDKKDYTINAKAVADAIAKTPTADVVPKSEYDALAEENESLEIELENMRRNLSDAREGWNDAECEVERLRKALDAYEETSGLKKAKAEVAREIFEEIKKHIIFNTYGIATISDKTFAELKKKWEGGR